MAFRPRAFGLALFAASLAFRPAAAADEDPSGSDRAIWQCAPFARMFSGIQLFGDAWTWWDQALGKYATGLRPEAGSVLVFKAFTALPKGHVAVVDHVLTDRIIEVTHANWSPVGGRRGQIENNVTVVDVSPTGDWSQVKVWYRPTGDLGTTIYPTYGFVYRTGADPFGPARVAATTAFDPAARAALSAEIEQLLH